MNRRTSALRASGLLLAAAALCLLLLWRHAAALDLLCRLTVREAGFLLPAPAAQSAAPQTTKAETTTAPTEPPPETTDAPTQAAKSAQALTATPDDIAALIQKAKRTDTGKKAGAVFTKTYTTEGVTDEAGAVRIKNLCKAQIDPAALLRRKADLTVTDGKPCVLIFHTHTTESYQYLDRGYYTSAVPTRDSDPGRNMVRVGDEICAELEAMGYRVLHDRTIHDARYTGAYAHSRESVLAYLKKYPSLQVLLDVHRDAIQQQDATKIKPTATVGGKKAAQLMIISGCQEGAVTDFPDWKQNLVFALQLQKKLETAFPGLTRPLFFAPRRYNMNLSHCSLLIEVGSDSNTLEEAAYSGRLLGRALGELLGDYKQEKA